MEWNEDNLEKFIRENKEKFDTEDPDRYHGTHFLNKLHYRLRQVYVSILPHLAKLAITTILVFSLSFFAWGNWLSPDRDKKSLGSVSFEYRMKEIKYRYYILNMSVRIWLKGEWCNIKDDIKLMDDSYDQLRIDLKNNPKDQRIIKSMNEYYIVKLKAMDNFFQQKLIVQQL